jgi:hypothetical protein
VYTAPNDPAVTTGGATVASAARIAARIAARTLVPAG